MSPWVLFAHQRNYRPRRPSQCSAVSACGRGKSETTPLTLLMWSFLVSVIQQGVSASLVVSGIFTILYYCIYYCILYIVVSWSSCEGDLCCHLDDIASPTWDLSGVTEDVLKLSVVMTAQLCILCFSNCAWVCHSASLLIASTSSFKELSELDGHAM